VARPVRSPPRAGAAEKIFFYDDHKQDLVAFCKLFGIPPKVV